MKKTVTCLERQGQKKSKNLCRRKGRSDPGELRPRAEGRRRATRPPAPSAPERPPRAPRGQQPPTRLPPAPPRSVHFPLRGPAYVQPPRRELEPTGPGGGGDGPRATGPGGVRAGASEGGAAAGVSGARSKKVQGADPARRQGPRGWGSKRRHRPRPA